MTNEEYRHTMYMVKYNSAFQEYSIRPHLGKELTWWIEEDHSWSVTIKANTPMEAFEVALTFMYDKQIERCLGTQWRKDFGQL